MPSSITIKESISLALIQLMHQKAFDEITASDIIKKSGVSRSSFYRTYKDKHEILQNYSKYVFLNCPEYHKLEKEIPLREYLLNILKLVKANEYFIEALSDNHLLSILITQTRGLTHQYLENHNISLSDYEMEFYAHAGLGILVQWIKNKYKESEEEITELFIKLIKKSTY